jgi:tetratricopeptide (TPR) repeat protein
MNGIYIKFLIVPILATMSISTCSFLSDKQLLQDYEARHEEAKWFFIERKFDEAENSYNEALVCAQKMRWVEGIVFTKTRLGVVYTATGNRMNGKFDKAENSFIEAIEICSNDSSCSGKFLGPAYDYLINLYIIKIKNIEKANSRIEEVIRIQDRLSSDRPINDRISDYAHVMRSHGYEIQAAELTKKLGNK